MGRNKTKGESQETLASSVFTREDENKDRGNWSGKFDFILSCIGYAVGLGNVWRFPYLCYKNGGGAFLIPYTVMLACCGLPLFFLEMALGQYASQGCIPVWKISPMFKGVGYAMMTITGLVALYYNVIIAYTVYYFFASLSTEVPWEHCNNDWNTEACDWVANQTKEVNVSTSSGWVLMNITSNETLKAKSAAEEYWENNVLELSSGIDDLGGIKWELALCLLFAWTVIFLCLCKGIKSTGKVVYFTATFPYVVLFILLIRGVTLDGAWKGIEFYIVPEWGRLTDAEVWGDAAVQIFYSLGPGWGGVITLSSYNRFHNNCYRDAIIVSVVNCGTSVFAGFAIFSVIGYMAHEMGVDVKDVADSGPGLAFVAYPAGLARMPAAPFWSVIFFFMLFTLGLDSMFAMMETIISALADEFPNPLRTHKTKFTLITCIIGFFLGLPMCTKGGFYLLSIMDWYSAGFSLFFVSLAEIVIIIYIYGYRRFADNIHIMVGFKPNIYWIAMWHAITPAAIICIIAFNIIQYAPVTLGDYVYPEWGETLGWLMVGASLIWFPIWITVIWIKKTRQSSDGPFSRSVWLSMTQPEDDWGPTLPEHRRLDKHLGEYTLDTGRFTGKDNPAMDLESAHM